MKKILLIFSILISLIQYNCKTRQIEKKTFYTIDSLLFNKDITFHYEDINPTYAHIRNDSLFSSFYPAQNQIIIYNLILKKSIDTITFNNFHINEFYYVNQDSIWIFGSYWESKNNIIHESILAVVNRNGLVKHVYNLEDLKQCGTLDHIVFLRDKYQLFNGNIAFSINNKYNKTKNNQKHESNVLLGILYTKTGKTKLYPNLTFLSLKSQNEFSNVMDYEILLFQASVSKLIISFRYTASFYVFDLENDKINTKNLYTTSIDTSIQKYYTFHKINDTLLMRISSLSGLCGFALFYTLCDTNFTYIGEGIYPDTWPYPWSYQNNNDYNFSDHRFMNFRIIQGNAVLKKVNKEYIINKINKLKESASKKEIEDCKIIGKDKDDTLISDKVILNYLNNFLNISDSSYSILVLSSQGCHGCNKTILDILNLNRQIFFTKDKPFFLLLIDNQSNINTILKEYPLIRETKSKDFILRDTTKLYDKINKYDNYNPRIISVKDKKLVKDINYSIDSANYFIKELFKTKGLNIEY